MPRTDCGPCFRRMLPLAVKKGLLLLLVSLVSAYGLGHPTHNDVDSADPSQCVRWQREFSRSQETVTASLPPNVRGKWVSEGCEVRPGPEFVLRRYQFSNYSFLVQQFYYLDESCTLPAFAISAWGRYRLTRPSWVVPGGFQAEYLLHRVNIVAYSSDMADFLAEKANRSCPGFVKAPWRPYRKYRVYSYSEVRNDELNDVDVVEDMDCLVSLHFSLNELQLMRLEHRKPFHHRHRPHDIRAEFFLGDVHSSFHQRAYYRPSSYQPPLLSPETPGCRECHLVAKSSEQSPPQLPTRAKLPVYLSGEWVSTRCEVRPYGLFLTRHFRFFGVNQSWHGSFQYYRDPGCRSAMFLLQAEGRFTPGGPSSRLRGATNYDFHVYKAFITPQDSLFVNNLNGYQDDVCGTTGAWRANVSRDVTSTGGCVGIGLVVPSTEGDVVKMDVDHHGNSLLYLGQVNSDPKLSHERPTSYQIPLIQCGVFSEYPGGNVLYPLPHIQYLTSLPSRSSTLVSLWVVIFIGGFVSICRWGRYCWMCV